MKEFDTGRYVIKQKRSSFEGWTVGDTAVLTVLKRPPVLQLLRWAGKFVSRAGDGTWGIVDGAILPPNPPQGMDCTSPGTGGLFTC